MRSLFTRRSWHYSLGFDPDLDFCFWVLERDGLQVPPFDRHPDGNGSLRAAGLAAASWRAWLERNISASDEEQAIVKASKNETADFKRLRELEPAALWNGSPAVGQRLTTLAEEFEELSNDRAAVKLELVKLHNECDAQLWKDLAPYRRILPPVEIIAVGYPGPVLAAMPPRTILLAVGDWEPTPSELAATILDGMQALAESAQPHV